MTTGRVLTRSTSLTRSTPHHRSTSHPRTVREPGAPGAAHETRRGAEGRRRLRLVGVGLAALLASTASTPATGAQAVEAPGVAPALAGLPAAAAPELKAVGLGDSVPEGGHCDCTPYVERSAQAVGDTQGRAVSTVNWATSGYDSADLARQLNWPGVRRRLAVTELTIVQVGANDFDESRVAACRDSIDACFGDDLRSLRANLTDSLATIDRLQRNARAEVLAVGYWNVVRDGAVGRAKGADYVVGSERLTRRVNAVIAAAARDAGVHYIDSYTAFKGDGGRDCTGLLAPDGDHPNSLGHETLSRSLMRQLGPLAQHI